MDLVIEPARAPGNDERQHLVPSVKQGKCLQKPRQVLPGFPDTHEEEIPRLQAVSAQNGMDLVLGQRPEPFGGGKVCHHDPLRGYAEQRLEIALRGIGIDKDRIGLADRPRNLVIVVAPRIHRQIIGIV